MVSKVRLKENWSSRIDMFVWTIGFQNPLTHTHFNMFVDEWTSANDTDFNMFVDEWTTANECHLHKDPLDRDSLDRDLSGQKRPAQRSLLDRDPLCGQ